MESVPIKPIIDIEQLESATAALELLAGQDEHQLTLLMNANRDVYIKLLRAVGAFTEKAAGNVNKIYEIVTALELSSEFSVEKYEIVHVKHEYGADVRILDKETQQQQALEIKTSLVKTSKRYKTNWLFTLNTDLLRRYREQRCAEDLKSLIRSVYEKQQNGVTCFVARHGTQKINDYRLSGAFVALYCVKKLINATSSSINFGSDRCEKCCHYHRIVHLRDYANRLDLVIKQSGKPFEYRLDYFDSREWSLILRRVDTNTGCHSLTQ